MPWLGLLGIAIPLVALTVLAMQHGWPRISFGSWAKHDFVTPAPWLALAATLVALAAFFFAWYRS